jgi:SAM-dependent methyltransferase
MLDLARATVQAARPGEARVEFVEGHADAVPLAAASVDLVISTFVLQLVPDRLAALREARRLLRPTGMVGYLTWLDRDSRRPFVPAEEFDEAVYDLEIDELEGADEPHAGDVRSGRTATNELRRAGFVHASAMEDELVYGWSHESYLEYKLNYDERFLMRHLSRSQRARLKRNARDRLGRLRERDFRWHAPVVFARALSPST